MDDDESLINRNGVEGAMNVGDGVVAADDCLHEAELLENPECMAEEAELLENPECMAEEAAAIYREYRESHPKEENPSLKNLIDHFENTRGPIIVHDRDHHQEDSFYFLPVQSDDTLLLDLATPPGRMKLLPMKPNPRLLPHLAILHSAYTKSLSDILDVNPPNRSHKENNSAMLFRIDTVGQPSKASASAALAALNSSLSEAPLSPATTTALSSTYKEVSSHLPLSTAATTSPTTGKEDFEDKSASGIQSMEDMRRMAKTMAGKSLSQNCSKTSEVATSLAEHHRLTPMTLDDKKLKKKERAAKRENELEGWYGMKRQKITDAERLEFKALELRGFIDPKKHYRGTKRAFTLANAESGFYQFGTVVNGGLADGGKVGVESKFHQANDKKRKTKSLIYF